MTEILPIDPLAMLTTKQAAARYGLSPETFINWRKKRKGPPFVRLGQTVRYRPVDLEAWLTEHTVDPTAVSPQGKPAPATLQTPTHNISPHLRGLRGFSR